MPPSAFDLIIRGGTIVSSTRTEKSDIGIQGESIVSIGDLSQSDADEVVDATGLHVFPGIIDTQVHFREPGMEWKEDIESGTRSAVAGGVTTIFEMPNTKPPTTDAEALWDKLHRAHGRAWCDFAFFVGATRENIPHLAELERAPGTPGIKIFMGSSTGDLLVDDPDDLRRVLTAGKHRCAVHAEDEARLRLRKLEYEQGQGHYPSGVHAHPVIRDEEAAVLATRKLLDASQSTGRPVHVLHVSTADELQMIQKAKSDGIPVTAEVTPQHLWFHAPDCYDRLGTKAQMNPPVRNLQHRDALRQALIDGLFDVVGSDHAPHTLEEKSKEYPQSPSGMPGVQTLLPVMATLSRRDDLFSLETLCRIACENPALIYGISKKGRIAIGYDADVCLVDIQGTFTVEKDWLQSRCGWSPFEGERLHGRPISTCVRGNWVMREGEFRQPIGKAARFDWKLPGN